jgi:hypothetical protein
MLESDPKSVEALRGLAAMAIRASDFDTALEFHVRLIDLGERLFRPADRLSGATWRRLQPAGSALLPSCFFEARLSLPDRTRPSGQSRSPQTVRDSERLMSPAVL